MSKNYIISKLTNLKNWVKFETNSPQSNIFSSKETLENFKDDVDLYEIRKGDEIKSLIYLYSEDKKKNFK